MRQSAVNISILILLILCIEFNESKPITRIQNTPLRELDFLDDRTNLFEDPLTIDDDSFDTERHKRNCFLYAMKLQNSAPKWMCW